MDPVINSLDYTNEQWNITGFIDFTNIVISKLNEMIINFTIINKINF